MKPDDFFIAREIADWSLQGLDPEDRYEWVFDGEQVEKLRHAPLPGVSDVDAAYGLTRLAHRELLAYGTDGRQVLDEEQIATVLRTLRAILKRLGTPFDPPFRDYRGFHGYWSAEGMGGSWAARRGYLSSLFDPVLSALDDVDDARTRVVRGVDGQVKNIIFASTGPKPRIVLADAINNTIKIERNEEFCLVYDEPLQESGLTWGQLVGWWEAKTGSKDGDHHAAGRALFTRLAQSLDRPPEKLLFRTYCERYGKGQDERLPALLPQVYLHYDPYSRREREGRIGVIRRERMDFLLLLPNRARVVLEVDGKQHYSEGERSAPHLYSEMVSEDRKLRLSGYEIFRFGGYELTQPGADELLREFFDELLALHV